jgi:hypothetical protein
MTPAVPEHLLIEALNLVEEYGGAKMAVKAGATDIPPNTIDYRVRAAKIRGLKPTFRKDAPRIYTRQRLGRMHMVVPDTQVKQHVNTDHLEWAGNYAAEKRPDVIVMIGDWFDMPSLSSYDKGKLSFEGRRYVKDIKAGRDAMERFLKPFPSDYKPEMHFTLGNHEQRIIRCIDSSPEFEGKLSYGDLGLEDYGWKVHDFLKPVEIDGILYCHYFTSGVMGRPVSSAAALLRTRQQSCTQGHVQNTDMAIHPKTQNIALFAGTFYSHDEDYLGYQGNNPRRHYDPMMVSMRFLEKAYA